MLAPKYINTRIIHNKNIERSYKAHEDQLRRIKSRKPSLLKQHSQDCRSFSKLTTRWKSVSNRNAYSVRVEEIKSQNWKILERLVDISMKKSLKLPNRNSAKKSLNFQARKKQAEEIGAENAKIAKRIADKLPKINALNSVRDFELHLEVKNRISRVQVMKNRQVASAVKGSVNSSKYISPRKCSKKPNTSNAS